MSAESIPQFATVLTLVVPSATRSRVYDGFDYAEASSLELSVEHGFFSARPAAYDPQTIEQELAAIEQAARQKGVNL